jgi:hypothetical protein
MSLNKLTTSIDYLEKQYLNIGCNDIKCSSLEVAGKSVKGNETGQYTTPITIDDGSTVTNVFGNYVITCDDVGAMVDLSVCCKMTNATATLLYNYTVTLPDGYKVVSSNPSPVNGIIHNRAGAYSDYVAISTTCVAGSTQFIVSFNGISATPLPVGVGENFVQFTVKIKCYK